MEDVKVSQGKMSAETAEWLRRKKIAEEKAKAEIQGVTTNESIKKDDAFQKQVGVQAEQILGGKSQFIQRLREGYQEEIINNFFDVMYNAVTEDVIWQMENRPGKPIVNNVMPQEQTAKNNAKRTVAQSEITIENKGIDIADNEDGKISNGIAMELGDIYAEIANNQVKLADLETLIRQNNILIRRMAGVDFEVKESGESTEPNVSQGIQKAGVNNNDEADEGGQGNAIPRHIRKNTSVEIPESETATTPRQTEGKVVKLPWWVWVIIAIGSLLLLGIGYLTWLMRVG